MCSEHYITHTLNEYKILGAVCVVMESSSEFKSNKTGCYEEQSFYSILADIQIAWQFLTSLITIYISIIHIKKRTFSTL